MSRLRYPPPSSIRGEHGLTFHRWDHPAPPRDPVLLIHGYGSNSLDNWVRTGWLDPLCASGHSIVSVDLPGHGASVAEDPRGLESIDILTAVRSHLDLSGDHRVVVHGYSLGARLAWQFAAEHPATVSALVVGGASAADRIARVDAGQARRWAAGGPEPEDAATRQIVTIAAALGRERLDHKVELLLGLAARPHDPAAAVPTAPTLVVAGERDEIASDAWRLAELVRTEGAPARFLRLPKRNHVTALTSRDYKTAVIDHLSA